MKTLVPMLTIKKLTKALEALAIECKLEKPNLGAIYIMSNGTLEDTKEEIEKIAEEAMAFGI